MGLLESTARFAYIVLWCRSRKNKFVRRRLSLPLLRTVHCGKTRLKVWYSRRQCALENLSLYNLVFVSGTPKAPHKRGPRVDRCLTVVDGYVHWSSLLMLNVERPKPTSQIVVALALVIAEGLA